MRLSWKLVFQHPPCSRAVTVLPREATPACDKTHVRGTGAGTHACRRGLLGLTPQGADRIRLCRVLPAAHLPLPTRFLCSPATGAKRYRLGLHSRARFSKSCLSKPFLPLLTFSCSSSSCEYSALEGLGAA